MQNHENMSKNVSLFRRKRKFVRRIEKNRRKTSKRIRTAQRLKKKMLFVILVA